MTESTQENAPGRTLPPSGDEGDRGAFVDAVDHVIRSRKTVAYFPQEGDHAPPENRLTSEMLDEIVQAACWAPYHKVVDFEEHGLDKDADSPLPFRLHVFELDALVSGRQGLLEKYGDALDRKSVV